MNFFGYFVDGADDAADAVLRPLGPAEPGGGLAWRFFTTDDATIAARAPDVNAESGVIVAISGTPQWQGGTSSAGRAADARSLFSAYRAGGLEAVLRLEGRFALALLDREARLAFLAIDPMGIERLTFSTASRRIVFGSSADSVAGFPGVDASISRQAVFDYLMLHMIPAPRTIHAGVQKLRAGHAAIWRDGRLDVRRWWQPRFVESGGVPTDSLEAELRTALRTAVRGCTPDRQSGAFLSGGLDSSTVAGMLREVRGEPVDTFSIGFGYPEFDELSYARIANQRFGCRGHEYTITGDDIADSFPVIARAYDEPFGNSSALPLYYCARLAAQTGIDHLLAGDGGDELFAGNSRYARQVLFARYERLPKLLRKGLIEPFLAAIPERARIRPFRRASAFIGRANVPLPERLEIWNLLYRVGASDVLHPDFLATVDPAAPLEHMKEVWDSAPCESQLNRLLYYDWQYTLADNDLRKVGTMAGLAGVRVSYPMLHPDVVGLSLRVPPRVKMPGSKLRHFYKQAMSDFLPNEIITKPKHGFGLPFGLWLHDSPRLRDLIVGNLTDLRKRNIVRPSFLDHLLQLHGTDDASYHGVFVWVLAMLEQWFQERGTAP